MVWRRIGDKPLFEPLLTPSTDTCMRLLGEDELNNVLRAHASDMKKILCCDISWYNVISHQEEINTKIIAYRRGWNCRHWFRCFGVIHLPQNHLNEMTNNTTHISYTNHRKKLQTAFQCFCQGIVLTLPDYREIIVLIWTQHKFTPISPSLLADMSK